MDWGALQSRGLRGSARWAAGCGASPGSGQRAADVAVRAGRDRTVKRCLALGVGGDAGNRATCETKSGAHGSGVAQRVAFPKRDFAGRGLAGSGKPEPAAGRVVTQLQRRKPGSAWPGRACGGPWRGSGARPRCAGPSGAQGDGPRGWAQVPRPPCSVGTGSLRPELPSRVGGRWRWRWDSPFSGELPTLRFLFPSHSHQGNSSPSSLAQLQFAGQSF